jgi:hypothetical protein
MVWRTVVLQAQKWGVADMQQENRINMLSPSMLEERLDA